MKTKFNIEIDETRKLDLTEKEARALYAELGKYLKVDTPYNLYPIFVKDNPRYSSREYITVTY